MNKTKRILSTIAAVLLSAAVSMSAFAADYYASDESGKASVPEYIESIKVSTEGVDISKANEKNTYELTPDGNLSLVDDYSQVESYSSENTSQDKTQSKEFLTVTTKSGNTFYIIVDRDGTTENVHFLNMVDEADLMALLTGDEVTVPETTETTTQEEEEKSDDEAEKPAEKKSNSGAVIVIVLLLAGGGFAYYWFKVKPNKGNDKPEEAVDTDSNYEEPDDDTPEYETDEGEVNENE